MSEARRHASETGASVLLLSDGHANRGVTDPAQLGSLAAKARTEGITTTTIGIGQGYDEVLLAEVATQGSGSHRFAFDADGLKHLVVALGALYAGEERQLLLHFPVPALASLGHHHLADIAIEYVALPELLQQTITWPLAVNAVPGDEASGRIPDPTVTTARLLPETTVAKRQAGEALGLDDGATAASVLDEQRARLQDVIVAMQLDTPEDVALRDRLEEEAEQPYTLAQGARERDSMLVMKSMAEAINLTSRGRDDKERRMRNRSKRDF